MFFNNEIDWGGLTVLEQKKRLYANDFYFEFSYQTACQILRENISQILSNYTLVFIKPEAFITQRINILIDDLKKHGFELVYVMVKDINNVVISELWKYSWSAASLIRIIVNQTYYTSFPGGVLVLRNLKLPSEYENVCAYFSAIKGHTVGGSYKAPQIRYHMNAINIFLNHIHSPDDNADLIRELAIFCDWKDLSSVYNRIAHNDVIDFNELYSQATSYPYYAEETKAENVLDNYIINTKKKMNNSFGLVNTDKLMEIHNTLSQVRKGNIKFTDSMLEQMVQNDLWSWDWESFIMLTEYMEYFNGNSPLL